MSHSYKRNPVYKDGSSNRRRIKRYYKKLANKKVRRTRITFRKTNMYRKICETWNICDYRFYYGKFVRSYKTFELAKGASLYWNGGGKGWGNVDQSNIIRVSLDEKTIAEMERDFDAKMPKNLVVEKATTFGLPQSQGLEFKAEKFCTGRIKTG